MRIGLLVCDHIQDRFTPYPELFSSLLSKYDIESYYVCDENFPKSAFDHDIWIISGSKYSVYDDISWIKWLKSFVVEIARADKYCIGVCFGHQMLGEAMGGKVQKSPMGWCVGVHRFEVQETTSWMKPKHQSVNLLMSCQDQIQVLPPNCKVLTKASKCPVGMIQIGEKMLGIQGHPEFSTEYVKFLMEERSNRIGQKTVKDGLESLSLPLHSDIVSNWINKFITQ